MDIHVGLVDAILAVGLIVSIGAWLYLSGACHGLKMAADILAERGEEIRQKRIAMLSGDAHTTKQGNHHG